MLGHVCFRLSVPVMGTIDLETEYELSTRGGGNSTSPPFKGTPVAHTLVDLMNASYRDNHRERDTPFRRHLGGSQIGKKCDRELYYIFRWFKRPTFDGRMLRLFDRGHREESNFISLLQSVGVKVQELDPSTGKQWRIADIFDHFGGSLDGIGQAAFPIEIWEYFEGRAAEFTGRLIPPGEDFLTEFKTHNTKSFSLLVNGGGVKVAKPEHYIQMQIYMRKRGLRFGLYLAINKNDDDLHLEIVELDPEVGDKAIARADRIINALGVPDRIGKHPSWHDCKFCDFAQICHYGDDKQVDRNCRTCRHSSPVAEGQWHCGKWQAIIPVDAILKGCESHLLIRD
jgi:hypothetical protein